MYLERRALPKANKITYARSVARDQGLHAARLASMKPSIDITAPAEHRHLRRNKKREQMMEGACARAPLGPAALCARSVRMCMCACAHVSVRAHVYVPCTSTPFCFFFFVCLGGSADAPRGAVPPQRGTAASSTRTGCCCRKCLTSCSDPGRRRTTWTRCSTRTR